MIKSISASARAVRLAALSVMCLALAGCGNVWLGAKDEARLPGERIPLATVDSDLAPDPALANTPPALPEPARNVVWPLAPGPEENGGTRHLALTAANLGKPAWTVSVRGGGLWPQVSWPNRLDLGALDPRGGPPAPPPGAVVAGGHVYTLDAGYSVTARTAATGAQVWRTKLDIPKQDRDAFGGGLAHADGRVFVTTGYAGVYALDAATGEILWDSRDAAPIRAAPAAAAGRVVTVNVDSRATARSAETGETLWTHAGYVEEVSLAGGSGQPAIHSPLVMVPYASGELYALSLGSGRPLWDVSLRVVRYGGSRADLSIIRARPVSARDLVYAISDTGKLAAISVRTGREVWSWNVGGVTTPWLAGDVLFVVTGDGQLAALNRLDGRVHWRVRLTIREESETRVRAVQWTGPTLAGNRLLLGNSKGEVWAFSPYTGEALGSIKARGPVRAAPMVADGVMYIQTDSTLSAYQ